MGLFNAEIIFYVFNARNGFGNVCRALRLLT
jgi:hypothetical protein